MTRLWLPSIVIAFLLSGVAASDTTACAATLELVGPNTDAGTDASAESLSDEPSVAPFALPRRLPSVISAPRVASLPEPPAADSDTPSEEIATPAGIFAPPPQAVEAATQDKARWQLSLAEALRLGVANNPAVRVFQQNPAIVGTVVVEQSAAFDPVAGASVTGGRTDRQVRSLIQTFGATSNELETDLLQPLDQDNNLYMRQQLRTGGQIEIGVGTDYQRFNPEGVELVVNPGWDSEVNLRLVQPIFRGSGVEVAEAPLRIACADSRRSVHDFRAELRRIARDIELEYWRLATAYRRHQAAVSYRRRAEATELAEQQRMDLGVSAKPEVLLTQSIVADFRRREANEYRLLRLAELRFRTQAGVAGLRAQAIEMMVHPTPTDDELDAAVDFNSAVPSALNRPELHAQSERIQAVQHSLAAAENGIEPDVRLEVDYTVAGLEERLDQSIGTLSRHEFNQWRVGLNYERRLGLRSEQAVLQRVRLQLAQEVAQKQRLEHDLIAELRAALIGIEEGEKLLAARRREVEATREQVAALEELNAEDPNGNLLFQILDSLRILANVERNLANAWGARQEAIANWRYASGADLEVVAVDPGLAGAP